MNSLCILLTDYESINEPIILNSYRHLLKSKIKKIYFIGSKDKFKKIYIKFKKKKKFEFLDIKYNKDNVLIYLQKITKQAIKIFNKNKKTIILNMPIDKKSF